MTDDLISYSRAAAATMGTVLSRVPLASAQDFFEAGGDSLRAIEVISSLVELYAPAGDEDRAEELYAELLVAFFDDATADGLALVIRRTLADAAQFPVKAEPGV